MADTSPLLTQSDQPDWNDKKVKNLLFMSRRMRPVHWTYKFGFLKTVLWGVAFIGCVFLAMATRGLSSFNAALFLPAFGMAIAHFQHCWSGIANRKATNDPAVWQPHAARWNLNVPVALSAAPNVVCIEDPQGKDATRSQIADTRNHMGPLMVGIVVVFLLDLPLLDFEQVEFAITAGVVMALNLLTLRIGYQPWYVSRTREFSLYPTVHTIIILLFGLFFEPGPVEATFPVWARTVIVICIGFAQAGTSYVYMRWVEPFLRGTHELDDALDQANAAGKYTALPPLGALDPADARVSGYVKHKLIPEEYLAPTSDLEAAALPPLPGSNKDNLYPKM